MNDAVVQEEGSGQQKTEIGQNSTNEAPVYSFHNAGHPHGMKQAPGNGGNAEYVNNDRPMPLNLYYGHKQDHHGHKFNEITKSPASLLHDGIIPRPQTNPGLPPPRRSFVRQKNHNQGQYPRI